MTGGNSTFASSGGKGNFIPFQGLFQNRALWTRFFILVFFAFCCKLILALFEVTNCDIKLEFRELQKDKALLSILAQRRAFIIFRAMRPPVYVRCLDRAVPSN